MLPSITPQPFNRFHFLEFLAKVQFEFYSGRHECSLIIVNLRTVFSINHCAKHHHLVWHWGRWNQKQMHRGKSARGDFKISFNRECHQAQVDLSAHNCQFLASYLRTRKRHLSVERMTWDIVKPLSTATASNTTISLKIHISLEWGKFLIGLEVSEYHTFACEFKNEFEYPAANHIKYFRMRLF